MKNLLLIAFFFLLADVSANIAQPGIYSAGGGSVFTLLFPEDSTAFDKVSMDGEQVSILMYPGFAVVRGEYTLRNLTDSSLTFHLGYPVNHIVESEASHMDMASVWFPDFYGVTVYEDGIQQSVRLDSSLRYDLASGYDYLDWYVWETTFEPGEEQMIIVYFLANTNEASVLQGYDKNRDQIFMYLLESGAVWRGPIGEGEIRISGRNGAILSQQERIATRLPVRYHTESQSLIVRFQNLHPTPVHNVILRGAESIESFDFQSIAQNPSSYYQEADRYSKLEIPREGLRTVEKLDPFAVTGIKSGWLVGSFMILGILAPVLIGTALVIFFVILYLRRRKKRPSDS